MQNGSNTWQQLLFSSLRGWKEKKKRSSLAGRISSKHGVHSQPRLRSRGVRKQEI